MSYDDVETLLTNSKLFIQFFALSENSATFAFWCLRYQNPPVFHQDQIRRLQPTVPNENGNDSIELTLGKIVEAAFDKMQVRAAVNCEDRSLDLLEENEGNTGIREVAEEPLLLGTLESNGEKENPRPRCIWVEEEEDPLEILYENLLAPVKQDITQEDIVIIPDGILFKVPFAALRDPNTNLYLSDTKRVRLAPSLTTLKALQESPANRHSRTGALIVGNPAVEEVLIKGGRKTFQRLPGVENEAKEIGDLMGVTPLIGPQATKEVLLLQTG